MVQTLHCSKSHSQTFNTLHSLISFSWSLFSVWIIFGATFGRWELLVANLVDLKSYLVIVGFFCWGNESLSGNTVYNLSWYCWICYEVLLVWLDFHMLVWFAAEQCYPGKKFWDWFCLLNEIIFRKQCKLKSSRANYGIEQDWYL